MFCGQCGKNLPDDVRFCQSCGRRTAPAPIPTSFTNATAAAAAAAPALSSSPAPGTANHQQLVEHYSGSSDEEILRLASFVEDLTEDAKNALAEEMKRRKLGANDLAPHLAQQEQLSTNTKVTERSTWGATFLTICVALCAVSGILYGLRSSGRDPAGGVGYAIGACIIPFCCWLAYFRRHYFTKTPVSTDGWSTTLVVVGILAASAASKNLTVKSPQDIVHEIKANAPIEGENDQNAKMRQTLTDLMELNKAAHAIDIEFNNSYGGKNFLGTGCFSSPDVAGECLADTQKALDGFEGVKTRMNALWKNKGGTPNPLQVAQYETMVKLLTDTTDLYRYAAEPSRQASVDPKDGRIAIVGVDEFNLKLNTALADQDSFRKATKAYVEYQNKSLGQLGLKPEDLGATHYNPSDFDNKAK